MKKVLFWFRNDLRLHDNEAFLKATQKGEVLPVYIIDKAQFVKTNLGFGRTGKYRAKFLLESLNDLKNNLKAIGSDLIVKIGVPENELFELADKYNVDLVVASKEVTQEETTMESVLSQKLKTKNVEVELYWGNTLIHARDLPFQIHFLPDVFTDFRKKVENYWKIRPCFENPSNVDFNFDIEIAPIPTLKDLGFDDFILDEKDENRFLGGETHGLSRLNEYLWQKDLLKTYKETRNGMMGKDYSSKLSAWLSLGCLSPRRVYEEIKKYESDVVKNESTYWLIFELLWRDYFHFIALKFGIRLFKRCGIKHDFSKKWKRNREHFNKWIEGKTGVPIVDACMRELAQTGYLSNRGRQIAASFFTKDLQVEWWWGAMYFENQLIDYEVCSNWGNWNYVAGIGTDPREDRYFNPINQATKYDSKAVFIKNWLPELQNVPIDYLLEIKELTEFETQIGDYPVNTIVKSKKW
jgi:deoxyribodipyrimidine photo-lyase